MCPSAPRHAPRDQRGRGVIIPTLYDATPYPEGPRYFVRDWNLARSTLTPLRYRAKRFQGFAEPLQLLCATPRSRTDIRLFMPPAARAGSWTGRLATTGTPHSLPSHLLLDARSVRRLRVHAGRRRDRDHSRVVGARARAAWRRVDRTQRELTAEDYGMSCSRMLTTPSRYGATRASTFRTLRRGPCQGHQHTHCTPAPRASGSTIPSSARRSVPSGIAVGFEHLCKHGANLALTGI